jgi:hypothetical protein
MFCNRFGTGTAMHARMARSISMPLPTFEDYYYGKRGKTMPATPWILLRITWDALLLAQWQQQHRPTDEEKPQ